MLKVFVKKVIFKLSHKTIWSQARAEAGAGARAGAGFPDLLLYGAGAERNIFSYITLVCGETVLNSLAL